MQRRLAAGLAFVLVPLLGVGCADGTVGSDPIATVPEPDAPPVPTLGATPPPDAEAAVEPPVAPTAGEEASTPTTAPAPGAGEETVQPPIVAEQDPAALGRALGITGLLELLDEDPDLAGRRGEDLQEALEDIEARTGRSARRRIDDLQDDIDDWVDDGDLDAGVGTAARAALDQAAAQLSSDDRDRDDDDDDDD